VESADSTGDAGFDWLLVVIVGGACCCCCALLIAGFLLARRRRKDRAENTELSDVDSPAYSAESIQSPNYGPLSVNSSAAEADTSLYGAMPSPRSGESPSHYAGFGDDQIYGEVPKAAMEVGKVYQVVPTGHRSVDAGWMINPADLLWGEELGRGAYGIVYDGMLQQTRVAIKVMTEMTEESIISLEAEASLMTQLRPHPNVIQLQGICHGPYSLVTEFAANGSLDFWLKRNGATDQHKLKFCVGMARGVSHLHKEGIIQ
jgi:Protein tyrosine and serine/threonine kinase